MEVEKKLLRSTCTTDEYSIPFDMVQMILQRLPTKSLHRFKCVCISWNILISRDYQFAKSHHLQQLSYKNSGIFLCRRSIWDRDYYRLVKFENGEFLVDSMPPYLGHLRCSADGLALLDDNNSFAYFLLWNPFTRQQRKIPPPPHNFNHDSTTFGFCRGPTTWDDYKIVARYAGFYAVYSCKNISWSEKKKFPFASNTLDLRKGGLCVGGFSFGVTYVGHDYFTDHELLYFDPRYETFNKLKMPPGTSPRKIISLTKMRGCLCLHDTILHKLQIWILKNNNVDSNSWLRITINNFADRSIQNVGLMKPLFFIETNKLVVSWELSLGVAVFGLYNFSKKKLEKLDASPSLLLGPYSETIPYLDTLFFPA